MKLYNREKTFYKSSPMRGISLITLVITIIVVIILAGAVILSLANNNPIETANEAVFKSDVGQYKDELEMFKLSEYSKNQGSFNETQLSANKDSLSYNGKYMKDIITSMKEEHLDKFKIEEGKLVYIGNDSKELDWIEDLELGEGEPNEEAPLIVNAPNLEYLPEATTKAVKWDENNIESEIALDVAKTTTDWYDYSTKKWANIYTNNNNNKAYWVWIPRYAYKIDHPHTDIAEEIHIKFLDGTTNNPTDGTTLSEGYTVHPAFTFGGKDLTGIWVAKYEASSSDSNKVETEGYTGGGNTTLLQVRILPNVYSWRNISNASIQTVSMNMVDSTGSVGTTTNLDTHQMKNMEWGAVAYLSQSKYGEEPWINPYGDSVAGSWKLKTGYAGASKDSGALAEGNANLHPYNDLTYGVNASTTNNIYGVYDMSGGANETISSIIDNGNSNISLYVKNEHIENRKIKEEFNKYYDIYEPGDAEKEGATFYGTGEDVEKLWNSRAPYNVSQTDNNIIRKSLSDAIYAKFENKKGDALWETSTINNYYGMYTSGISGWTWLKTTVRDSSEGSDYTYAWNSDYSLLGYSNLCMLDRGGNFTDGLGSGLYAFSGEYGSGWTTNSFRPVLVNGLDL